MRSPRHLREERRPDRLWGRSVIRIVATVLVWSAIVTATVCAAERTVLYEHFTSPD